MLSLFLFTLTDLFPNVFLSMKKFIFNNLQDSDFKNHKQRFAIQNDRSWQHAGISNAILLVYEKLHTTHNFQYVTTEITWRGYDIQSCELTIQCCKFLLQNHLYQKLVSNYLFTDLLLRDTSTQLPAFIYFHFPHGEGRNEFMHAKF